MSRRATTFGGCISNHLLCSLWSVLRYGSVSYVDEGTELFCIKDIVLEARAPIEMLWVGALAVVTSVTQADFISSDTFRNVRVKKLCQHSTML
jgi:hypothetical protein